MLHVRKNSLRRFYIGLATTFHDPAIAIVSEEGEVLFAEAAERPLQSKRALNSPPYPLLSMPELLREHCGPNAEYIIATSWSAPFSFMLHMLPLVGLSNLRILNLIGSKDNRALLKDDEELAFASFISRMQQSAGLELMIGIQKAFGPTRIRLKRFSHHLTHASNACYTSPYSTAVCAIIDGMGEFGSMSFYHYHHGKISRIKRHWGRESLGFLYAKITELCGYDWAYGEEWKVMGLAPYGKLNQEVYCLLNRMFKVRNGALSFASRTIIQDTLSKLKRYARKPDEPYLQAADIAFTGQQVFSEILLQILNDLAELKLSTNLIIGGGCGLNSSFNGSVIGKTNFESLHVPSAPGDDGNAIGAAFLAHRADHPASPDNTGYQSPYLGSRIQADALTRPAALGSSCRVEHLPDEICQYAAKLLADGKVLGWVQGRAEFGPRSLGNRSILADPRKRDIKEIINKKIKNREPYRPFAPSILHEYGSDYFENYQESPYMERTLRYRDAVIDKIPGVVHIDKTGRLQTVKKEWNPALHQLIAEFYKLTGVPLVLNTSFNIMGKPIIHSMEDAVGMFYTSGLDALVLNDYLIEK